MTDDKQKNRQQDQQNFDTNVPERPLDPSKNSSDLMGDPSGMTGWTVGSGPDTSAEPTEEQPSTDNLPGGIIQNETAHAPTGIPKEAVSDKKYNQNTWEGMSQQTGSVSDDRAEEGEQFTSVSDMIRNTDEAEASDTYDPNALKRNEVGNDTPGFSGVNTESAPYTQPENIGEQEVSGSTTDPASDDDTLANAQAVGTQLDENSENPQEVDLGNDIDKAEEYHRTH